LKTEEKNKVNIYVYEVELNNFTTPDGRYFDFDMLSEAVDSGKIKPVEHGEDKDVS
jgi:hypothetical protein